VLNSTMIFRASALALLLSGSAAAQQDIEVQRLDALDPMEVGLPDAALGSTLWDGTNAEMARLVLQRLPGAQGDGYGSIALGELARVVLSSGGYPPHGGRGAFDLAVLRVDRLLVAAGAHDGFDLLERTPNLNQSADLSRRHAELAFALADSARACRTADSLLDGREQAYWQRVRAFCFALEGQSAAAELTAELARTGGDDADFDALLYAITLGNGLGETEPVISSGLTLAMARHLDSENLVAGLSTDAPGWLRSLVVGTAPGEMIQMTDPVTMLEAADAETGATRTLMLEAVLAQGLDREAATAALVRLLNDARVSGDFIAAGHFYGREIGTLPITEDTLADGYAIALAALVFGDVSSARQWRHGLVNGPVRLPQPVGPATLGGPDGAAPSALLEKTEMDGQDMPEPEPVPVWVSAPAEQITTLDLLIAVAEDALTGDGKATLIGDWMSQQGPLGNFLGGDGIPAISELMALERLGASMPDDYRRVLLSGSASSTQPELVLMDAAARAGAQAETAMHAIRALHQAGDTPTADTLGRVIAALDAVGLREAARFILVERLVERAL
jgi:hypothetical protein